MSAVGKFKPFRGYEYNLRPVVLEPGEVCFEYNVEGPGKGAGKLKMGDGVHTYADLPYFLGEEITEQLINFDTIDHGDGDIDLSKIEPNKPAKNIIENIKTQLFNIVDYINTSVSNLKNNKADGIDSLFGAGKYAKGVNLTGGAIEWQNSAGTNFRSGVASVDPTDNNKIEGSTDDLITLIGSKSVTNNMLGEVANDLFFDVYNTSTIPCSVGSKYPKGSKRYKYYVLTISASEPSSGGNTQEGYAIHTAIIKSYARSYFKSVIYDLEYNSQGTASAMIMMDIGLEPNYTDGSGVQYIKFSMNVRKHGAVASVSLNSFPTEIWVSVYGIHRIDDGTEYVNEVEEPELIPPEDPGAVL